MRFLAVALALVVSAEGIKVKTTDESHSKEKWGFFSGKPYYQWGRCPDYTLKFNIYGKCCYAGWGAGPEVV